GEIIRAGLAHVLFVVQRGEGGGLGEQIDIEGLADFFEGGNEFTVGNAVADAQAGQTVNLREGPHEHQVFAGAQADEGHQIQRLLEEFDIGLVHHHEYVVGDFVDEFDDLLARGERAGGIVRVGHKNDAGAVGDGAEHGRQVV